ncbi:MAG: VCBS repeat-containing protein, partial [Planctomycetota bacterium]
MLPGRELTRFLAGDWQTSVSIYPLRELRDDAGRVRANQWSYVDFEGDGDLDVVVGHGSWGDYGWDDAYDAEGRWTRGPLHGHVYLLRNRGTTESPELGEAVPIEAAGQPIDVYGMPSPHLADFDADGDLDLLCGEFIDSFTYFENVGSRTEPRYAAGRPLARSRQPIRMPLCMIVVTAVDWDRDGDVDLVVGQEDGRVALLEHTGRVENGMPLFETPQFLQQQADNVKFGALATPVGFDWDGDGDEDLVCGNTAGEIGWIENLDGGDPPRWAPPQLLAAGGDTIRIMAGENGSIQGPAEAKWGYTTLAVADWDHDALPDVVVNSIWGKVVWYRNVGTRQAPRLAPAEAVRVAWDSDPPRPAWNWWLPTDGELATQWRTTPAVVDWNHDGLNDLVMLDHEGFLTLFLRERGETGLTLRPGRRAFRGGVFDAKHNRRDASTGSLRLNDGIAGRSGRRKLCLVDWDGDAQLDLLVNSVN